MAYNGSGVFTGLAASHPAVTGTVIDSTKHNNLIDDIATGLTTAICKDGQTTITANLPMATYKHTGVGDASALTDYASANQVVDNTLTYGGASAVGTDAYAVSLTISPGAYVAGNRFQFLTDVVNTGACTININSLGAKSIKLADGNDPYTGNIQANSMVDVMYDGTNFILLNPWTNYLEGTFTAELWDDTLATEGTPPTYSSQEGYYTKIGNMVSFSLGVIASAFGSITTTQDVRVGGLPYTNSYASTAVTVNGDSLNVTAGVALAGQMAVGTTYIKIQAYDATTGLTGLTFDELSANGVLLISGHYYTYP